MDNKQTSKSEAAQKARKKAVNKSVSRAVPYVDEVIATKLLRDTSLRQKQFMNNKIIVILSIALFVSMLGNFFLATQEPEIKYIAMDVDGKIKDITPLDQPIQSEEVIVNWAAGALTETYTMSFLNYREELSSARRHFTIDGWSMFEKALEDSSFLQTVEREKFVSSAVPSGAPVIINEGIIAGLYAYQIQVPLSITFESANGSTRMEQLVTVVVVRRSETESPVGLGIAQLIAE